MITVTLFFTTIVSGQENFDTAAIEKIKNEGLQNSMVEQIAFELIDKAGPRLTNSNGYARAADYAVAQFSDWGLVNSSKEFWGEFGKGWEVDKSYVAMTKPYYMPFIAVPRAWSTGTGGSVNPLQLICMGLLLSTYWNLNEAKKKSKSLFKLRMINYDLIYVL